MVSLSASEHAQKYSVARTAPAAGFLFVNAVLEKGTLLEKCVLSGLEGTDKYWRKLWNMISGSKEMIWKW